MKIVITGFLILACWLFLFSMQVLAAKTCIVINGKIDIPYAVEHREDGTIIMYSMEIKGERLCFKSEKVKEAKRIREMK